MPTLEPFYPNNTIIYLSITYVLAIWPATAPCPTAVAICIIPPTQSPAANTPSTLVLWFLSTLILSPSSRIPSFLAKSTDDAEPYSTNNPSISSTSPSPNTSFSSARSPLSSLISFLFILISFSCRYLLLSVSSSSSFPLV